MSIELSDDKLRAVRSIRDESNRHKFEAAVPNMEVPGQWSKETPSLRESAGHDYKSLWLWISPRVVLATVPIDYDEPRLWEMAKKTFLENTAAPFIDK